MRFRCDLQTYAVTVDGSRLDDDGLRGSTCPVSGWIGDPSFVDGKL